MRCNYCDFKSIKNKAQKVGLKVSVLRDADWGMEGVNVYVHPHEVNVTELSGGADGGQRFKYWKAWFMSLPKACACD